MTVWKAFNIRRRNGGPNSRLIQTFLREGAFFLFVLPPVIFAHRIYPPGVFYYILISIANLVGPQAAFYFPKFNLTHIPRSMAYSICSTPLPRLLYAFEVF